MDKTRKKMGTNKQKKKKNPKLSYHRRSILLICMVLVVLSGALAVGSIKLHAKNTEYKSQEAELEAQIRQEEKRTEEVKDFEEYVKTDDYIKETAEDKLDLVDPNEIIFKPAQ